MDQHVAEVEVDMCTVEGQLISVFHLPQLPQMVVVVTLMERMFMVSRQYTELWQKRELVARVM
jgi:hypothetical protein